MQAREREREDAIWKWGKQPSGFVDCSEKLGEESFWAAVFVFVFAWVLGGSLRVRRTLDKQSFWADAIWAEKLSLRLRLGSGRDLADPCLEVLRRTPKA